MSILYEVRYSVRTTGHPAVSYGMRRMVFENEFVGEQAVAELSRQIEDEMGERVISLVIHQYHRPEDRKIERRCRR